MRHLPLTTAAVCAALMFAVSAHAQPIPAAPPVAAPIAAAAPPAAPPPYGTPITLEQAKKVAAAAQAEARKIGVNESIAITEPNGQLVYLEKMDGTQYAGNNVAIDKAVSAALYRRPTAAFDAGLRAGATYLLTLRSMNAVPGGLPIVVDGKLIGGIGVAGGSGPQDVQVAEAGLLALSTTTGAPAAK